MSKYLLFATSVIILFSCKKAESSECITNCKTFHFNGRVYNGQTNAGFSNTPFALRWIYFRYCIFCPPPKNDIYNSRTDGNGNFSITVSLDTSLFSDYSLTINTPDKENYFNLSSQHIEDSILNRGDTIKIMYYPSTMLTLKLRRTQIDTFENFQVKYNWVLPNTIYATVQDRWLYYGPKLSGDGDTTFNITTIADNVTTAIVDKFYSNGTSVNFYDSLKCLKNVANVIQIDY